MKTITHCLRAAVLTGMLTAGAAFGQSATTTTTTSSTTSDGTVSDFSPTVITVRSTTAAAPVAYSYSKTTTYVDEAGNPVQMETVRSGAPVTVYYTQDGDRMMASKVVVHKTTTVSAPAAPVDAVTTTTVKRTTTTTSSDNN